MGTYPTVLKPSKLSPPFALQVCKTRCASKGMPYFGLQYGRECRCGEHPPSGEAAGNCVSPCTGDRW
ncbi:unnamed protein product, partial [Scytosiphon promiscuus]